MAYALIAGLPIQYGIYGSAIAAMVAPIFAKSHFITIGPTNATSVMLLSAFASLGMVGVEKLSMVPLLILMVGLFVVIGAYFKVANLGAIHFPLGYYWLHHCSRPTDYHKSDTKIPRARDAGQRSHFYQSAVLMFQSIHTAHWATLIVSLSTALLFFFLNKNLKHPNVAICLVAISAATELILGHDSGIKFLSRINAADWSFQTPEFSLNSIQLLASPALAIALLCILEGISIGNRWQPKQVAVSMLPRDVLHWYGQHCLRFFFRNARLRFANSLNTKYNKRRTHSFWQAALVALLSFLVPLLWAADTIHSTMHTRCLSYRNRNFAN